MVEESAKQATANGKFKNSNLTVFQAIICVMEHEVLATKAFRNIVKILLTNISFEDIVTLKYDKVVDLSVMGGKHKLACKIQIFEKPLG